MATLEERLADLTGLPTLPATLVRVLALLSDEDGVELGDLEVEVVQDPALSLLVLRMANSAAYAGMQEIGGLRDAIARLGTGGLRRIITAHHGGAIMAEAGRGYGLDAENARHGALAGALAAELLAGSCGASPNIAFTAALLRDCGKLVLDHLIGVERLKYDMAELGEGAGQIEHEQLSYGFDHAYAGAALARSWNLPEPIPTAIAQHHIPGDGASTPLIDVVHVADIVCAHLGLGVGYDGLAYPLDEDALKRLGIDRNRLSDLIVETAARLSAFDPS
jgi:HD-like signal output (HDOD) protein